MGEKALHIMSKKLITQASFHGKEKGVQILIDNGANIESLNNYGKTSLHTAALSGQKEMWHYCLKEEQTSKQTKQMTDQRLFYTQH